MKTISLTKGQFVMVDDEDVERLSFRKWQAAWSKNKGAFYAQMSVKKNGKSTNLSMHRFIMNAPKGIMVDHIDGNPLNNQKSNLRFCSLSQNMCNRKPNVKATSKFKGVHKHKGGKWLAAIKHLGIRHYLGLFDREEDAATAYNEMAKKFHGDFARLNQPVNN